eukprot:4654318-Prymnesium_polylepis.1
MPAMRSRRERRPRSLSLSRMTFIFFPTLSTLSIHPFHPFHPFHSSVPPLSPTGKWQNYFHATRDLFGGREVCECLKSASMENRFYSDETHAVRVGFSWLTVSMRHMCMYMCPRVASRGSR